MSFHIRVFLALFLALMVVVITVGLIAAFGATLWEDNGVRLCSDTANQSNPDIVSDGSGGAIVTWFDARSFGTSRSDIYAQRVDGNANDLWVGDGVSLCIASDDQYYPKIASDGAGGAVVVWRDKRSGGYYDIYARRVYSDGTVVWTANGVQICGAAYDQRDVQIISDGAGGAIAAWRDYRSNSYWDIYAQRVYSNGTVAWTTDGVSVCTYANNDGNPQIAPDGSGGAIVTWGYNSGTDVHAQRLDADGNTLWTIDGVTVCNASGIRGEPTILPDWSGGAIIAWTEWRGGPSDIYAQRLDSNGNVVWHSDGISLCTASDAQWESHIASDGSGGAIVAWRDGRTGSYDDVYAQRVRSDGTVAWTTDGISISTEYRHQAHPRVVADGSGGAILVWYDERNGYNNWSAYAQHLDANGNVLWPTDGLTVCDNSKVRAYPVIASDGSGGAIIAWADGRASMNDDIYAQRVADYHTAVRVPLVMKLD